MQKKYDENNVFNKIVKGELPAKVVYDDQKILAFEDINPKAPVHILVIPKKNFICFDDFVKNSAPEEVSFFFKKVQEIAENNGLSRASYRIVANCGEEAGQIVPHFHVHIMGYK